MEKKYKELTLDDISIILLKMTTEKDAIAEILFKTLSPKERAELIDALLQHEVARLKKDDLASFMRHNTILSALMANQRMGFNFDYTLLDSLPEQIRKLQVAYKITDKERLSAKVRDVLYHNMLNDFLKSLPNLLEQLSNTAKYNCHLLAKNLLKLHVQEQQILQIIGGYIFLRNVFPNISMYVRSEAFKTKHSPETKLAKPNMITEEDIFTICAEVVAHGIASPVVKLSNAIGREDPDNPDKKQDETTLAMRRLKDFQTDAWPQKAYEIAICFQADLQKCLRKLAKSESVELSKDSLENLEAKQKITTSKSIEWDVNSIIDNYIRKLPAKAVLQFTQCTVNSSENKQNIDENVQTKAVETTHDDSDNESRGQMSKCN